MLEAFLIEQLIADRRREILSAMNQIRTGGSLLVQEQAEGERGLLRRVLERELLRAGAWIDRGTVGDSTDAPEEAFGSHGEAGRAA